MTGSPPVRVATRDDLPGIIKTFLDCWRISYASVMPATLVSDMTDERAAALWEKVFTRAAGGEVLAAVDPAGDVCGVTRFSVDHTGVGYVGSLYVSPHVQGKGFGARLLDAAVTALRAAGAHTVTLWVFADNAPSIEFYRRQGFTPDGGRRVEPEFAVRELRLRRDLGCRTAART